MKGFRSSRAVVIGINEYQHGIPRLRTAVNDARRIAEVLETQFGYAAQLVAADVTLGKLRSLFGESLPKEVQPDDRLLVYFAGHGIALDGDDGPAGFLVPQDARTDDRQTFLPMTDLNRWLDRLPCRHLLLVLDCCFAGAFPSCTAAIWRGAETIGRCGRKITGGWGASAARSEIGRTTSMTAFLTMTTARRCVA